MCDEIKVTIGIIFSNGQANVIAKPEDKMPDTTTQNARRPLVSALFLDHPATVNESYFGHMRFAIGFSFWLFVAAAAALLHAVVPALCETTASRILNRLHAKITTRH